MLHFCEILYFIFTFYARKSGDPLRGLSINQSESSRALPILQLLFSLWSLSFSWYRIADALSPALQQSLFQSLQDQTGAFSQSFDIREGRRRSSQVTLGIATREVLLHHEAEGVASKQKYGHRDLGLRLNKMSSTHLYLSIKVSKAKISLTSR